MGAQHKTIKDYIRTIPDFPHEGIMFRDVTTLFADPRGLRLTVDALLHPYVGTRIDKVVGLEARGFILGGAIAHQLGVGFVPVRKAGKLPGRVISQDYELEYGSLIEKLGGKIVGCGFIIDLPELGGRAKLEAMGMDVHILCEFDGH